MFTQQLDMDEFNLKEFNKITSFLKLEPFEKATHVKTRNEAFPLLTSSPLETIFELMYRIYCFFNIEENILNDVANGYCSNFDAYNLRMFRILATQKPVDDLSIYRKRFGYNYVDNVSEAQLDLIRNSKMSELFEAFEMVGDEEKLELIERFEQFRKVTVYKFFSELCKLESSQLTNCFDCMKFFNELEDMTYYDTELNEWFSALQEVFNNSSTLIRTKPCKK